MSDSQILVMRQLIAHVIHKLQEQWTKMILVTQIKSYSNGQKTVTLETITSFVQCIKW